MNPTGAILFGGDIEQHLPHSITQPLLTGTRNDGTRDEQPLLHQHWFMDAESGGGLTNMVYVALANLHRCADTMIWGADPLHHGWHLQPWMPRLDWAATTIDEAARQVAALTNIIEHRLNTLARRDKLTPSCDRPAIVYVLPEAAALAVHSDRAELAAHLGSVVHRGQEAAVSLVFATRYGTVAIPRTWGATGEKFTARYLLRTRSQLTATMVLGADAEKVDIHDLEHPGQYFKRAPGGVVFAKAPLVTRSASARLAKAGARTAPVLDAGSAAAGGPAYATRHERIPANLQKEDAG
ncbi:hypothetical protein ACFY05_32045 [Microtetraspora fusca]|uniref:Cell division protein FtsK n=1 Tax=Microtetraspora fusca TaxID=1997 RepID=A0ABW6VDR6_MICFU